MIAEKKVFFYVKADAASDLKPFLFICKALLKKLKKSIDN